MEIGWRYFEHLTSLRRTHLRALARSADGLYRPFHIAKKSDAAGVASRHVDNPSPELGVIQRQLAKKFLSRASPPMRVMGGIRGIGTKDAAVVAMRQPLLVSIDLEDFFPSISRLRVFNLLREEFGAVHDLANTLSFIFTRDNRLPQGAPSSTAIANLVCGPVVEAVQQIVSPHRGDARIWVDDIKVTGGTAVRVLIPAVLHRIQDLGFRINRRKLTVAGSSSRQVYLGITHNRVPGVLRERLKSIRRAALRASMSGVLTTRLRSQIGAVGYVNASQRAGLERRLGRGVALGPIQDSIAQTRIRLPCRAGCAFHSITMPP